MPGLRRLQAEQEQSPSPNIRSKGFIPPSASSQPEDIDLWLPSTLSPVSRSTTCPPSLCEIEEKLRTAQCNDALESIRHILRVKSRMVLFKHKQVRGQREGTRSRAVIDRVHARARAAAEKYRASREAKYWLCGPGDWEKRLRPLLDSDIRAYQDPNKLKPWVGRRGTAEDTSDEEAERVGNQRAGPVPVETSTIDLLTEARGVRDGTGESRRTISWIWVVEGFNVGEECADDDILRSEWAKSRARACRAMEEVLLLREEMRRTIEYLKWKANWWQERAGSRSCSDKLLAEGLRAYALEQAALQRTLSTSFQQAWRQPLEDAEEGNKGHDEAPASDDDEESDEEDEDGGGDVDGYEEDSDEDV